MEYKLATLPALGPALPEIILAVGALALLMFGAFRKGNSTRQVSIAAVLLQIVALVFVVTQPLGRVETFGGMFVSDEFSRFIKALILIGSSTAIIMSIGYVRHEKMDRFEFPVLITLATVGMLMMVSANGLISLYMGIELQSLALYVIAAFNRDNVRSSEAGLKYFVLGALSSGILLYGMSLVYGFTGTTEFDAIARILSEGRPSLGVIFGLVFIMAGLAFKISAVPFHMWTPDVYEGAPTPVTALFSGAPKVAAMALILRVLFGAFPEIKPEWQQIIVFVSLASMILGAFAAIGQTNIKRLMAYSSIGHMGFALVGLAAGSADGIRGVIIYLAIYLITNIGVFCCILAMRRDDRSVETIADLAGLSRSQPVAAFVFAMLMFSLAGVPPLAGFFGKFYVFLAAMQAGLYWLAVIGVLSSVVGAFYYLRVVKVMYFDEPAEPFDLPVRTELSVLLGISGLFTIFFFAWPAPLVAAAQVAATALLR